MRKLFYLPLSFFDVRSSGDIVSRINNIDSIQQLLSNIITGVFVDVLTIVISISMMLYISRILSIIMIVYGILLWVLLNIFFKKTDVKNKLSLMKREKTQSYLIELSSNINMMKTSNYGEALYNKWVKNYNEQMHLEFKRQRLLGMYRSLIISYRLLPSVTVLFIGSNFVNQGMLTLGQVMSFLALGNTLLSPLAILIQNIFDFQYSKNNIDRLSEIITAKSEKNFDGREINSFKNIKFQDVNFSYSGINGKKNVKELNFTINEGEFISFVGRTGCGKTTIIKLILSLYNNFEGNILLNNIDKEVYDLKSYRQLFGTVLQDETLLNDTIQKNIDPTHSHTISKIREAAKLACLDEDVMNRMPSKYNTEIGDNGRNLSGGQRQRVAIARALLTNPKVIILDEGTSQLDVSTEREIFNNLKKKNITIIAVTHKLSTTTISDCVYVLKKGKIIAHGKHEKLMQNNRYYSDFFR